MSAGPGEIVLVVMGSSARTAPELGAVPTDAAIVAILEGLSADGERLDLGRVVQGAG